MPSRIASSRRRSRLVGRPVPAFSAPPLQPGRPGERIIVGLFRGHVPLHRDDQGEYLLFDGARKVPAGFEEEIRRHMAGQKQDPPGGAQ